MKKSTTLTLTEAGVMIALATALSLFKLIELPYGGSVTFASMLPILIFSYRHGLKYGISAALTTSVIQLLLGLKNFSYFTSWYSLLALAILDYIVAFSVFGLVSLTKKLPYRTSLIASAMGASILRYICHVVSGATVWAGLSIPTEAALVYSLGYNATYMIPETIVLVCATAYITSAVDFSKIKPQRTVMADGGVWHSFGVRAAVGFIALGALIFDTLAVFSKLQDAESGDFVIENLALVNWLAILIVTAAAILISALIVVISKRRCRA